MMKHGRLFRGEANTWDPETRIADCAKTGVDVQVLSTVPVMFHYWARPEHALETSQFFNDDIASTCKEPRRISLALELYLCKIEF